MESVQPMYIGLDRLAFKLPKEIICQEVLGDHWLTPSAARTDWENNLIDRTDY